MMPPMLGTPICTVGFREQQKAPSCWLQAVQIREVPPQAGIPCHVVQVAPGGALLLQGGFRQANQR